MSGAYKHSVCYILVYFDSDIYLNSLHCQPYISYTMKSIMKHVQGTCGGVSVKDYSSEEADP